jgi:hypothetical protein
VDVAAGTDALDDLLAEVAAFGEVKCAGLGGLLGQVVGFLGVANVGAVAGSAFEDAEVVEGFGGCSICACGEDFLREGMDCCVVRGPELDARDERAVGVDDFYGCVIPNRGLQAEGYELACRDAEAMRRPVRWSLMTASSTSSMMMNRSRWVKSFST